MHPAVEIEGVALDASVALIQPIRITLRNSAPLEVEYWSGTGPILRVQSEQARDHVVALTRLRPDRLYQYRIIGSAWLDTFRSPPLPADLQALTFTATGTGSVPLVLLHLYDQNGYRGYAIVDASGTVVWYRRTVDFPFGAARRANGNFVLMDKARGLIEVSPAGDVVAELAQSDDGADMHHDVIATPANTLLYIAHDERVVDGVRVQGDAIWEWSPETGMHAKRWSSWDHLSPVADHGPRFGLEWLHANALALGTRGNVLLSVHYFNQVLSLSPDLTRIEWRLGGVNGTITPAAGMTFSGQHTPQEVGADRVLLFDNALEGGGPSRALELALVGNRAEPRWEWSSPEGNFASAVSSARRLTNGNTLIAFGMSAGLNGSTGPTEVFEVSQAGTTLWRLRVTGTSVMFRAEPLAAVGSEAVVER